MLRSVIVEDEPTAQQNLVNLLGLNCPEVKVVGIGSNVSESIHLINELQPDLLFLDIQLGNETSFAILDQINSRGFQIIFVTAYHEHAIQAFNLSATDYLLKPINPLRLQEAVAKCIKNIGLNQNEPHINTLANNLTVEEASGKKIVLSTVEMIHVVDVSSIVSCQSHTNYTIFHFLDKPDLIISKTLKTFDDQLSPLGFFRVHRSWLINPAHISGYDKREGGFIMMDDKSKLPVSSKVKDELLKILRLL